MSRQKLATAIQQGFLNRFGLSPAALGITAGAAGAAGVASGGVQSGFNKVKSLLEQRRLMQERLILQNSIIENFQALRDRQAFPVSNKPLVERILEAKKAVNYPQSIAPPRYTTNSILNYIPNAKNQFRTTDDFMSHLQATRHSAFMKNMSDINTEYNNLMNNANRLFQSVESKLPNIP